MVFYSSCVSCEGRNELKKSNKGSTGLPRLLLFHDVTLRRSVIFRAWLRTKMSFRDSSFLLQMKGGSLKFLSVVEWLILQK